MEEACRTAASWPGDLSLWNVNVSSVQLRSNEFVATARGGRFGGVG